MKIAARPALRRLMTLDRLLRAGEFPNAATAAALLEVHPRTIHRDLEFLRDSWGAPLAFSHEHNGYYYNSTDYALPFLRLTEGEFVALFLAERLLQQYQGTPIANDIATAFAKLNSVLADDVTVDVSHLQSSISVNRSAGRTGDAAIFGQLAGAVRAGRQLELVYWTASRGETCRRVVDPYHLASVEGDWYLAAYCHLREDVRLFAPSRIKSLRETEEEFERPADFRIGEILDGAFRIMRGTGRAQKVRLRFGTEAAPFVRERQWHPKQELHEGRDGSVTLTLWVNHLLEVKRFALSWGQACEVLEPKELREQIAAEARGVAGKY